MARAGDPTDHGRPSCSDAAQRRVALLYKDQGPGLRRRLRRRLGSSEEASDLVHDAFARLLGAAALDAVRAPEALLNRIVRNLLFDRSRRLSIRAEHVEIDDQSAPAVRADQADAIEVAQVRQLYQDAVAALPARTREVFLLHRVEELRYKQIAARLGIGVRTVEWHIAEAIVRIGRALDAQ
jgi:RNA polymerase sigma-70 factor (ECF subfamily)